AGTGVRPGEAYPLEWKDVDLERRRVWVRRNVYRGRINTPKSSKAREIVLPPMARDALVALPRVSDLVFTAKRGGMLSQPLMTGYFSPACALFGRNVHRHELRHFTGHYLYVTLDLPARVVAAQLGHSSPRLVEELYGHFKVGALEEIDRAFKAKVTPIRALRVANEAHEA
ncbi:MAG TPA: tyrosine-type recombinase/integrase, partial [Thermoleophilaceae bacterium]|nr:tyrosine-type recombinase/integrase [Thermoleophilaceae bacterium]